MSGVRGQTWIPWKGDRESTNHWYNQGNSISLASLLGTSSKVHMEKLSDDIFFWSCSLFLEWKCLWSWSKTKKVIGQLFCLRATKQVRCKQRCSPRKKKTTFVCSLFLFWKKQSAPVCCCQGTHANLFSSSHCLQLPVTASSVLLLWFFKSSLSRVASRAHTSCPSMQLFTESMEN